MIFWGSNYWQTGYILLFSTCCSLQYFLKREGAYKQNILWISKKSISVTGRMSLSNMATRTALEPVVAEEFICLWLLKLQRRRKRRRSFRPLHAERCLHGEYSHIVRLMHAIDGEMHFSYFCMSAHSRQLVTKIQRCTTKRCNNLQSLCAWHKRHGDIIFGMHTLVPGTLHWAKT